MKNGDRDVILLIHSHWTLLNESLKTLLLSIDKVNAIGVKSEYSFEEMESFDSLSVKFSRSSDIYTQKVLRSAWILLHEPFLPFIDLMNQSEKMGLVHSSDELIAIRDLRNQISHEYIPEAVQRLIPEVIILSANLSLNIDVTRNFLTKRDWL